MDIETAFLAFLADLGSIFTVTPMDLQEKLPAVRVSRVGGPRDQLQDYPTLDIQTYTRKDVSAPRSSLDLGNAICERLLGYPFMADSVLIDEVECRTAPTIVAYPDNTLSVTRAVYTLTLRK